MSILIVEDNPTNGLILRHLLKKVYSGDIHVIEDPLQALEICQLQMFKLIVVDQMLPRISGVQFVRFLRHMPNFVSTPIVMVTGDSDPRVRAEAVSAGVSQFLLKPVEAISFRNMVSQLTIDAAHYCTTKERVLQIAGV